MGIFLPSSIKNSNGPEEKIQEESQIRFSEELFLAVIAGQCDVISELSYSS